MANKQIKIEVTEADFLRAVPRNSGHCAISDAIRRQVPDATAITTDLQSIRWTNRKKGERYIYFTPRTGQLALINFDQGEREALQPFTLHLRNPHVVPVTTGGRPSGDAAREAGRQRIDALTARENAGEQLSSDERRTLTRSRRAVAGPDRPTSPGPRVTEVVNPGVRGQLSDDADAPENGEVVRIVGGDRPPIAALAHGMGHRREFGVRVAGTSG
jgi:hypothetical protein